MNNKRKFRCVNYGNGCPKADGNVIVELDEMDILDGNIKCPHCKQEMEELPPVGGSKKKIIIIAAAVILLGVVGFFVFQQGKGSEPVVEEPKAVDTTIVTSPVSEPVDTLSQESETTGTVIEVEDPEPLDPNAVVTLDLGYAIYKGKVKNGKMHDDNGLLRFKQKHIIEPRDVKKREAEAGEEVKGIFEDGHLTTGTWFKKDGNRETIIP